MDQYFGHKPQDWERAMLQGTDYGKEMQYAMANPEEYTTSRPNMATKAAFTVGSMKGAGRDGLKKGPSTAYYKIKKPEETTPDPVPAEPEKPEEVMAIKDPGPIKYSPEVAQAKERVDLFKNSDRSIYYQKNKFSDEYLNRTYDPMKL